MKDYCRENLLNLAYEIGYSISSDRDLRQFEFELVINGDLDESVLNEAVIATNTTSDSTDIKKILELVTKLDRSINPAPSAYQSKKELITAMA